MSIISDGPIGNGGDDNFNAYPAPLANFAPPMSREMAGPKKPRS